MSITEAVIQKASESFSDPVMARMAVNYVLWVIQPTRSEDVAMSKAAAYAARFRAQNPTFNAAVDKLLMFALHWKN